MDVKPIKAAYTYLLRVCQCERSSGISSLRHWDPFWRTQPQTEADGRAPIVTTVSYNLVCISIPIYIFLHTCLSLYWSTYFSLLICIVDGGQRLSVYCSSYVFFFFSSVFLSFVRLLPFYVFLYTGLRFAIIMYWSTSFWTVVYVFLYTGLRLSIYLLISFFRYAFTSFVNTGLRLCTGLQSVTGLHLSVYWSTSFCLPVCSIFAYWFTSFYVLVYGFLYTCLCLPKYRSMSFCILVNVFGHLSLLYIGLCLL